MGIGYDVHAVDFDYEDEPYPAGKPIQHVMDAPPHYAGHAQEQQQYLEQQQYYTPDQAYYVQQAYYQQYYGLAPATDTYGDNVGYAHAGHRYPVPPQMHHPPAYAHYPGHVPTNHQDRDFQEDEEEMSRKSGKTESKSSQQKAKEPRPVKLPPIKTHSQLRKLEKEAGRVQKENLMIFNRLQKVKSSGYLGPPPKDHTKRPLRSTSRGRTQFPALPAAQAPAQTLPKPDWQ